MSGALVPTEQEGHVVPHNRYLRSDVGEHLTLFRFILVSTKHVAGGRDV